MSDWSKIFPQLYPEISDWPIHRLYQRRDEFVNEIDQATFESLTDRFGDGISKAMARTAYLELIRLKETPWKSDPPNERQFWKRVRKDLSINAKHREDVRRNRDQELLRRIIHRYSEEIAGNFNQKTFKFARKFLTAFFKRLLNTAAERNHRRIWGTKHRLYDRLRIYGDVERVRQAFSQGTVVIVPTHFSNLDSVLIGYALDTVAGLPSFSYGAGLNLYNSEMVAYYMSRLGAYKVDRRKRNHIYLETLKTMSSLSLQWGVNSLFFPGGTRSRSGQLEKDLKLGLLNSLVEAQRSIYINGKSDKIIVIPLVLSYHFVLEARMLVDQFLERKGEEKYLLMPDDSQSVRKVLKFAWQFFSRSSDITLSFGEPMDVLGNNLDVNGQSIDDRGNPTTIREYFTDGDEIEKNKQRETVYTRHLGKKIADSFHRNNVVLSSHIAAFAAFEMFRQLNEELDIWGLIRLPADDFVFNEHLLLHVVECILKQLRTFEANGEVRLSADIREASAADVLERGIDNLGIYHAEKPLVRTKKAEIVSQSFKLLFFYRNRLDSYDLAMSITWPADLVAKAMEFDEMYEIEISGE